MSSHVPSLLSLGSEGTHTTAEILLHGEKNACHKQDTSGIMHSNCYHELPFLQNKSFHHSVKTVLCAIFREQYQTCRAKFCINYLL